MSDGLLIYHLISSKSTSFSNSIKILFKLELSPTKYDFIGDSSNLKSSPYNLLPLIVDGD
jgi:hypothetical protein